ncbi:MAG TPA: chromate resistance protein ChrB domain-containing protein [Pinirhizobacter sp.]|uniref:chromate resistance protein ChrB domain-containing protein n=1 Tax=Pinirhizobacter sp. TaxID=2950432 RepID=UPI002B7F8534|nr:chromate resistance protein ChrB domain-containing protein [Pinirhizobacter sp.]HMH68095.1 chromate resistance protein ChrB domain-containing protein [Pinirhizobacter sp.]
MNDAVRWIMLVSSLPGQTQTARMRVWRALKAAGAGALRDGVYILPSTDTARTVFAEQATEVVAANGSAQIIDFDSQDEIQQATLMALFDRGNDYRELFDQLGALKAKVPTMEEPAARRELAVLRRDLAAVVDIDFFPGPTREQVESALADAEAALNARFSPDEPHAIQGDVPLCDPSDYRDRLWATRAHLWIDRVASAWLIARFIDHKATFLWLARPQDCPRNAIGFDFDGATFTHRGARVTFEVLLASFSLGEDRALARLGNMVHYLDVGGVPVPEAAGFAAIMAGARATQPDDDALLRTVGPVLDSLYAAYTHDSR